MVNFALRTFFPTTFSAPAFVVHLQDFLLGSEPLRNASGGGARFWSFREEEWRIFGGFGGLNIWSWRWKTTSFFFWGSFFKTNETNPLTKVSHHSTWGPWWAWASKKLRIYNLATETTKTVKRNILLLLKKTSVIYNHATSAFQIHLEKLHGIHFPWKIWSDQEVQLLNSKWYFFT